MAKKKVRRKPSAGPTGGGSTQLGWWSAAGQARFAREARSSTAKFLSTAPLAYEWEAARMDSAYQAWLDMQGTALGAAVTLYGPLGYEPPYGDLREMAKRLVQDESARLKAAPLYVMSPSMCDIVVAAAQTLTLKDLELVDAADLPTPSGCLVLPYPIIVESAGGELSDDRAIVWTSPWVSHYPNAVGKMTGIEGVGVSYFSDTYGPIQPESFRQLVTLAKLRKTPLPPFMHNGTQVLPFLYSEGSPGAVDAMKRSVRKIADRARAAADQAGLDEGNTTSEYVPGSEIQDSDDTFVRRFLYAFWRLCEQRIVEVSDAPIGHAAETLAERDRTDPEVRIIELRQKDTITHATGAPVDWKHRWVVGMHKVRQWYPSEQRHKIILRGPYVKGPADKPLLKGEVVRALKR